jgi:hypothetical protein
MRYRALDTARETYSLVIHILIVHGYATSLSWWWAPRGGWWRVLLLFHGLPATELNRPHHQWRGPRKHHRVTSF